MEAELTAVLSSTLDGISWNILGESPGSCAEISAPDHLNDEWRLSFASGLGGCVLLRGDFIDQSRGRTSLYKLFRHRIMTAEGGVHRLLEDAGNFMTGREFSPETGRLHFKDATPQYWLEPGWWGYCECITDNWPWPAYINRAITELMGASASQEFRRIMENLPFGDVMAFLHACNNSRKAARAEESVSSIVAELSAHVLHLLEKQDGNPLAEMMTDRGIIRGVGNRIGYRLRKFWDRCSELLPGQLPALEHPLEFTESK
ncbi:MAG: hypothetical protein WC451_02310 [Patescibacteria group bacterium]